MAQAPSPELLARASSQCELCSSSTELTAYLVEPNEGHGDDQHACLCSTCADQLDMNAAFDDAHWTCLSGSAWTTEPSVQVLVYRLLKRLESQSWAAELLEQIYLEESVIERAAALPLPEPVAPGSAPVDCNGQLLADGDSVTIIKNLDVKGSSMVAKRGTAVRNIRLTDDPTHVEGKVNGMSIYLKTCFLKKS